MKNSKLSAVLKAAAVCGSAGFFAEYAYKSVTKTGRTGGVLPVPFLPIYAFGGVLACADASPLAKTIAALGAEHIAGALLHAAGNPCWDYKSLLITPYTSMSTAPLFLIAFMLLDRVDFAKIPNWVILLVLASFCCRIDNRRLRFNHL